VPPSPQPQHGTPLIICRCAIKKLFAHWLLQVGRREQGVLDGGADVWYAGEGVGSLGRLLGEPLHQGTVWRPRSSVSAAVILRLFAILWQCVCVSGARCRLFAYGPADATASQNMSFSVTFFRRCRGTVPSVLALTLLVGRLEEHPACKSWVMGCWCGYLSTAIVQIVCMWSSWCQCIPKPHHFLPHLNPDCFYLSGTSLPRLSSKRDR